MRALTIQKYGDRTYNMTTWTKSFMGQIVGYFLLLSFVTVGVISGVAYTQSRHAIKQSLVERLTLTATLKEDELNRWIKDQRQEMVAIINLPAVKESILTLMQTASTDAVARHLASMTGIRTVEPSSQCLTLADISVMSDAWKQELCNAAIQADGDWVARLAEQIPHSQPSLATRLMNLVHRSCFDEIFDLLDSTSDAKSVHD